MLSVRARRVFAHDTLDPKMHDPSRPGARTSSSRRSSFGIDYARYVAKRWWWLVVGGAGGVLTIVTLVTPVSVPSWLGIVVLVGGLAAAQSLAFKDLRGEQEDTRKRLIEALTDRRVLLRKCYGEGRKLQARIALRHGGATEARLQEVEGKNRTDAYTWAKAAWEMLQEHFPGQEQAFMGPERTVVVKAYGIFDIYCENAVQHQYGNSLDRFLEAKLDFLARLDQGSG